MARRRPRGTAPHLPLHEAVAAAVKRRYPQMQVEGTDVPGQLDGWELDLKGGTAAERKEAMEFAKRFAEGWKFKPEE